MNRLKLLVASVTVALISGCSFSVKHRGHDGCGEPGVYTSNHTCQKCGKKSKRFGRTMPLYPGDNYGQWGDPADCGCGETFSSGFQMDMGTQFVPGPFMEMSSGCSSCGGGMAAPGMISGGCGAQGGAIDPTYLNPPAIQKSAPAPAPPAATNQANPIPAPVPPASDPPMPMPEPSPMDEPAEPKQPMNDPVPAPFDSNTDDGFRVEPNAAPAAETPADPVSWEIPQLPR